MPKAKKTKSGKYTISVYDYQDSGGKQHYKRFTADTRKEVELLAAQFKNNQLPQKEPEEPPVKLQTVDDALEKYIDLRVSVLSPSTIRGYYATLIVFRKEFPEFMDRAVNSITEDDMQELISTLAITKSPKTVKNYKSLICSISDRFRAFKITLPSTIRYEPYVPTEAEIMTLIEGCRDTEIEVPVMLGAYCMMRRGEICALDIRNVDFERKKIFIQQAYARNQHNRWVLKQPKTKKSYRTITVADFVLEKIKQKGYITTLLPDQLTERFERKLISLHLNTFRFHDLRHYCCSMFHYRGIPMSYVQEYGGWSTMTTVQRIYQHTLNDKKDDIYEQINNYFTKSYEKHNSKHNY